MTKQVMEDALDIIENGESSYGQKEGVAQALRKAIEGYDKQEP